MRATIERAWHTLRADRPGREVALRLVAALAITAALWACGCVFLLLEPVA